MGKKSTGAMRKYFGLLLVALILLIEFASISSSEMSATITVCPGACTFPSIQEAVDAASSGDIIEVQAGIYEENVFIDSKSLTLRGAGPETTIVASPISQPGIFLESASIITGGDSSVVIDGMRIGGAWDGVYAGSSVIVQNSIVVASRIGIIADGILRVFNNHFIQQQHQGINGQSAFNRVTGSGNHFKNSTLCGNVDPAIRVTEFVGTQNSELRVPGDYMSIQDAIDALKPGGTIYVDQAHFFQENVSITKSLTLEGDPSMLLPPTLDGSGRTVLCTISVAEDVVIDGFRFQNGLQGLTITNPRFTLRNSHVRDAIADAVGTGLPHGLVPELVTFENNIIELSGRYGIILSSKEALISSNRITNNYANGIYVLAPTSKAEFKNNTITDNGDPGWSAINAGWGISEAIRGCDVEFFFPELPLGDIEITGSDNAMRSNGNGDVCPASLEFLKLP